MKYLVNRETKEHCVYDGAFERTPIDAWEIVEADSEGWIPCKGDGACPLPDDCMVDVRYEDNEYCGDRAEDWGWHDVGIAAYRPILAEQSKPEKFLKTSEWSPDYGVSPQYVGAIGKSAQKANENISADVTVFDRLRTAIEHADSIPSIIAEIDGLLGPDYQVVRVEKVEATAPQEDMSDWRNWRPGDLVELKDDAEPISGIRHCVAYRVGRVTKQGFSVVADCEGLVHGFSNSAKHFKFISRPTGATK